MSMTLQQTCAEIARLKPDWAWGGAVVRDELTMIDFQRFDGGWLTQSDDDSPWMMLDGDEAYWGEKELQSLARAKASGPDHTHLPTMLGLLSLLPPASIYSDKPNSGHWLCDWGEGATFRPTREEAIAAAVLAHLQNSAQPAK